MLTGPDFERLSLQFESDEKFLAWKDQLGQNGIDLLSHKVLSIISRDGQHIFAALVDSTVRTPDGHSFPRVMFFKGSSVAVIPCIKCTDDGEYYTLMVEQRRFGIGGAYSLEFPSGTMDHHSKTLLEAAVTEMQEELHLTITEGDLIPLEPFPIVVNTALMDEAVHYYYFRMSASREFLLNMDGQPTGIAADNEFIKIRVQKLADVWKNGNFLCATGIKLLEKALGFGF